MPGRFFMCLSRGIRHPPPPPVRTLSSAHERCLQLPQHVHTSTLAAGNVTHPGAGCFAIRRAWASSDSSGGSSTIIICVLDAMDHMEGRPRGIEDQIAAPLGMTSSHAESSTENPRPARSLRCAMKAPPLLCHCTLLPHQSQTSRQGGLLLSFGEGRKMASLGGPDYVGQPEGGRIGDSSASSWGGFGPEI